MSPSNRPLRSFRLAPLALLFVVLAASPAAATFQTGRLAITTGQSTDSQTVSPNVVPGEIQSILLTATFDEGTALAPTTVNVTVPVGLQYFASRISSQGVVVATANATLQSGGSGDGDDAVLTLGTVSNAVEEPAISLNDFVVIEIQFAVSAGASGQLPVEFELLVSGASTGTAGTDLATTKPTLVTVTQTYNPTTNVEVGDDVTVTAVISNQSASTDPNLYETKLQEVLDAATYDTTATRVISVPSGYSLNQVADSAGNVTISFEPSTQNLIYAGGDADLEFVYTVRLRTTQPVPTSVTGAAAAVANFVESDSGGSFPAGFTGIFTQAVDSAPTFTSSDTDGDGLTNQQEADEGTDPTDADSDDDGVADGQEVDALIDTDNDGLINMFDPDSDNDGILDGVEAGISAGVAGGTAFSGTDATSANFQVDGDTGTSTTSPVLADTDGDGIDDGVEDANRNGVVDFRELDPTDPNDTSNTVADLADTDGDGTPDVFEDVNGNSRVDPAETDPNNAADIPTVDTDGDGLFDLVESAAGLDPDVAEADIDGDGVPDAFEDTNGNGVVDAGESDPRNPNDAASAPDADGDGIFDGLELLLGTDPNVADADVDADGFPDVFEDVNQNGITEPAESDPATADSPVDSDSDGIPDLVELLVGTNPADGDTDSDDDGVPDLDERGGYFVDLDGDGLDAVLDPDSDEDGILDGTELGFTTSTISADTDLSVFVPDADGGTTTTSPTTADTDGDGVKDGFEDINQDGEFDASSETDPNDSADANSIAANVVDSDGDGIPDVVEEANGLDPKDADTDDDGILDGSEDGFLTDIDRDGLIGAADPDSDGDGIFDGTEKGVIAAVADPDDGGVLLGTDPLSTSFVADSDPSTTTSAVNADTDYDGINDGFEDLDRDGLVGDGETDPNNGTDGVSIAANVVDTDGDGLPDVFEASLGLDPSDLDSDDDGIGDAAEPGGFDDGDADGLIGALDGDSDNDGIPDSVEFGVTAAITSTTSTIAGTATTSANFVLDADASTTTSVVSADTDGDGLDDASEDLNRDGAVDTGETDPGDGADAASIPANLIDQDEDGIADVVEDANGLDPLDADSDDDGVADGDEPGALIDADGDGSVNALDPDSDDDGLVDGLELGITGAVSGGTVTASTTTFAGTNTGAGVFQADADPDTTTNPQIADTDGDGKLDGEEDRNQNGRIEPGETDPNASESGTPQDAVASGGGGGCALGFGTAQGSGGQSPGSGAPLMLWLLALLAAIRGLGCLGGLRRRLGGSGASAAEALS